MALQLANAKKNDKSKKEMEESAEIQFRNDKKFNRLSTNNQVLIEQISKEFINDPDFFDPKTNSQIEKIFTLENDYHAEIALRNYFAKNKELEKNLEKFLDQLETQKELALLPKKVYNFFLYVSNTFNALYKSTPQPFDALFLIPYSIFKVCTYAVANIACRSDPTLKEPKPIKSWSAGFGIFGAIAIAVSPFVGAALLPEVLTLGASLLCVSKGLATVSSIKDLIREWNIKDPQDTFKYRTSKHVAKIISSVSSMAFYASIGLIAIGLAAAALGNPIGLGALTTMGIIAISNAVIATAGFFYEKWTENKIKKIDENRQDTSATIEMQQIRRPDNDEPRVGYYCPLNTARATTSRTVPDPLQPSQKGAQQVEGVTEGEGKKGAPPHF